MYVSPEAPGLVDLGSGTLTAAGVDEIDAEAVRGTRAVRSVVGKASRKSLTDVDPGDNSDSFRVRTRESPADLAVTATKASGDVGDTVTVTVSVKNNGPADSAGFTATVTAPTGTELVDAPKACTAKTPGRVYVCQAGNFLDKGEVAEQDFSFRITAAEVGSDGKVTVAGRIPDHRPQNNTAKLSINDTSGGGGLPVTGYQVSLVAGTGAALLLAGAVLLVVGRRRRAALAAVTTVDSAVAAARWPYRTWNRSPRSTPPPTTRARARQPEPAVGLPSRPRRCFHRRGRVVAGDCGGNPRQGLRDRVGSGEGVPFGEALTYRSLVRPPVSRRFEWVPMRLPAVRRAAVRFGSILVVLVAVAAMALAGGTAAPAAPTDPPSWGASVTATATLPDQLLPRVLAGSPSASPSVAASPTPTPTPGASERPGGPGDPDDEGTDGSGSDDTTPDGVDLSVTLTGPRVDVGPGGASMRVDLRNRGKARARDVRLTIDATKLAATVTVALPSEGCTTDPQSRGRKVSCAHPGGLAAGATGESVTFFLMPEAGTAPAPGGAVTVSVTSGDSDENPADNTATSQVRVVESAVDLVAQVSDVTDLAPGQAAALAFVVANQGTDPAHGMTLEFTLPPYATFIDDFQTCTYAADRRRMVCDFATVTLAQGQALTAADFDPIQIRVAPDAPGPATLGRGTLTVTTLGQAAPLVERGAGPALRTIATRTRPMASVWPRGADTSDHVTSFAVSVTTNPVDLAVAPNQVSGKVGDVVRVQISVTNNGPADAAGGFRATIDAPTGSEIVGVPPECRQLVAGRRYECVVPHQIEVGAAQIGQLNLRITAKKVGADGAVTVTRPDGVAGADLTPDNNRAAITVTVGDDGSGGGWLPVTGSQVNMMAWGGIALLVVGFGLYSAGRRRRSGDVPASGQVAENPPSTQMS